MIRKLQLKFVIINMAMITAMLCVIFGLVYHFTRSDLESESIRMMQEIAADPFRLGRPDESSEDLRLPYFTLQLGMRGELIATGGGYYDLSDQDFLMDLIEVSLGSAGETGTVEEHGLRFCRVTTPRGTVLVFADMSSENSTLSSLVRTLALIGAFSFLIFLGISIFLSRWAVRPVAEAWLKQKQFVADASHELKTPLTVIMTNAELLQGEEYDDAQRRQFSRGILLMSQQMRLLVERMLSLAKSDAEQPDRQMGPVELSRLVLDSAISFEGVFVEHGLTLESDIAPDITVQGNDQGLEQVVDILLDNARKYSSPGGQTLVRLQGIGGGRCRLTVSNPGPEIPAEELKRIFRRFYRLDEARSRNGSFGLGLSIAESIVKQHKGKIWAESKDGVNTFFVELCREHKARVPRAGVE